MPQAICPDIFLARVQFRFAQAVVPTEMDELAVGREFPDIQ